MDTMHKAVYCCSRGNVLYRKNARFILQYMAKLKTIFFTY